MLLPIWLSLFVTKILLFVSTRGERVVCSFFDFLVGVSRSLCFPLQILGSSLDGGGSVEEFAGEVPLFPMFLDAMVDLSKR